MATVGAHDRLAGMALPTWQGYCVSKIPDDHREYLQRRPFEFGCATTVFPPEELQVLAVLGHWLTALATGMISPVTPEQEHFVQVDRAVAEPVTTAERAWVRLKGRREFEQEQHEAPAAAPPASYDMVEWDADRCWW